MFSFRRDRPDAIASVQLDTLMEGAGDAVFRLDADSRILYASKRASGLIGHDDICDGRQFSVLVVSADRAAVEAALGQAHAASHPVRVNARIKTTGAPLWLEFQITAYATASGADELLAVGRDISSQQATE